MQRRKTHATIIATSIRKKGNRKTSILQSNQKLLFLTVLLICGVLLGILFVKYTDTTTFTALKNLLATHFQKCVTQSLLLNILSCFGTDCLYLSAAVLLGMCIAGEPFLWILPLIKGIGIGTVSACLYKAYTLQGLEYYAFLLLLPTVLSAAALLFGCKESILYTRDINRCVFKRAEHTDSFQALKLYLLRHFVLLLILLFSAVCGAVLLYAFYGKVSPFSA